MTENSRMSASDIYSKSNSLHSPKLIEWFCSLSFETYLARMRSCMAAPSPENFEMRPSPVSRTRTRSKTGFEPRRAKCQCKERFLLHTILAYACCTGFHGTGAVKPRASKQLSYFKSSMPQNTAGKRWSSGKGEGQGISMSSADM